MFTLHRVGSLLKPALSASLLLGLAACNNSPVSRVAGDGSSSGTPAAATTTPDAGATGSGGTSAGSTGASTGSTGTTGTGTGSGSTGTSTGSGSTGTGSGSTGSGSTGSGSGSSGSGSTGTGSGGTTSPTGSGGTTTPTTGTTTTPTGATTTPVAASKVGHVWVIMLENEDYKNSFATTAPDYLARTLPAQGALLKGYYGTGHNSLDNYISLISGQGANPITQADCDVFQDFQGQYTGQAATNYQAVGQGCVYPTNVPNIADQLGKAGLTWKGYMEDMGNDATRGVASTCGHPAINAQDKTQTASSTDGYATRHNPFMYFHSIIDDDAGCKKKVVNLTAMDADLASVATTPVFNFIVPGLCSDGHDSTCANGDKGGLVKIDAFLQTVVPKITSSAAFKQDGLLLITFDESNGANTDASGCCGNTSLNTSTPGIVAATDGSSGGGVVGAVAIAPLFIKPGTVVEATAQKYSHYSMLKTWEDLLGLSYLGYANQSGITSFGKEVFTLKMPDLPKKS